MLIVPPTRFDMRRVSMRTIISSSCTPSFSPCVTWSAARPLSSSSLVNFKRAAAAPDANAADIEQAKRGDFRVKNVLGAAADPAWMCDFAFNPMGFDMSSGWVLSALFLHGYSAVVASVITGKSVARIHSCAMQVEA